MKTCPKDTDASLKAFSLAKLGITCPLKFKKWIVLNKNLLNKRKLSVLIQLHLLCKKTYIWTHEWIQSLKNRLIAKYLSTEQLLITQGRVQWRSLAGTSLVKCTSEHHQQWDRSKSCHLLGCKDYVSLHLWYPCQGAWPECNYEETAEKHNLGNILWNN